MSTKRCHFCGRPTASTYACVDCSDGGFCRACIRLHECGPEDKRESIPVLDEAGNDTGLIAFLPELKGMN